MKPNTKEWIQYCTAIVAIISGIVLAFLSFFLNAYDITDGVLWYIAQVLVYAGSIFGVGMYFHTKLGEFESRARQDITELINNTKNETTANSKGAA